MSDYKISGFRRRRVFVPIEPPIRTAHMDITGFYAVTVELSSNSGHQGEAYIIVPSGDYARLVETMLDTLWPLLKGKPCADIEQCWWTLFNAVNWIGHEGLSVFAISAFDTALWDLHAKHQDQPVHALLGTVRKEIKAYASGGLFLSLSIEELQEEASRFVKQGFLAMKIRIGSEFIQDDVQRVAAVREVIGDDIELMADANQTLNREKAIALGRQLENYQLTWFEDPVMPYALHETAAIRAAINIPVATGECDYTRFGLQRIIDAGAADIVMPDINRVGGVSEFYQFGKRAAQQGISVTPHMHTEESLQLCGALANCIIAEHMPWSDMLFIESMELRNGHLQIPERPGLGFRLDQDRLDALACD